jgi:hypothetical protein
LKDRFAAPVLVVTVVGVLIAYLTFAHAAKIWPYAGPSWMWVAAGGVCALVGLYLVLRRGGAAKWPLVWGMTCIIVGSIVGTLGAVGVQPRQAAEARRETSPDTAPEIRITSVRDGQQVDGPFGIAGVIDQPLRQGESLWVLVGNVSDSGAEPTTFYLQLGPCGVLLDEKTWQCDDVALASMGPRRVRFYVLAVRDGAAADLVRRLVSGGVLDYQNRAKITPDRSDARNFDTLPGGEDVLLLATVNVGLRQ